MGCNLDNVMHIGHGECFRFVEGAGAGDCGTENNVWLEAQLDDELELDLEL